LAKLLAYAQRFWSKETVALLLKGQNVEVELTESNKSWRMEVIRHKSRSDPSGVILEIRELHRVVARNSRA
jgi:16S rRNA (guanine527-N7)-methyltransferase